MLLDPAGGPPVVLRLQVAQHAAALAVHGRSGRLLCHSSRGSSLKCQTEMFSSFFPPFFFFFLFFFFSFFSFFFSQMSNRNAPSWIKCRLTTYKRGARVGTVRKTTNGHHQLALALTHHGVRKEKKNFKKENFSEKRILLEHSIRHATWNDVHHENVSSPSTVCSPTPLPPGFRRFFLHTRNHFDVH